MKHQSHIIAFVLLIVLISTIQVSSAEGIDDSGLDWFFTVYNSPMSHDTIVAIQNASQAQIVDCGPIRVSFDEIAYDGRWVYTSASVTPISGKSVLILPGSAGIGNKVAGGYGENMRNDDRSFGIAAKEDNKQLIAVYVYPLEYDYDAPYYFLDHLQAENDRSILLSGAPIGSYEEELTLHWSVQLYEVDISTGQYSLLGAYEYPVTVSLLDATVEIEYILNEKAVMPFNSVTLIQTALTTYVIPDWQNYEDQERYDLILLDEEQEPYNRGLPTEINTFDIGKLPETLNLVLVDYTNSVVSTATYSTAK